MVRLLTNLLRYGVGVIVFVFANMAATYNIAIIADAVAAEQKYDKQELPATSDDESDSANIGDAGSELSVENITQLPEAEGSAKPKPLIGTVNTTNEEETAIDGKDSAINPDMLPAGGGISVADTDELSTYHVGLVGFDKAGFPIGLWQNSNAADIYTDIKLLKHAIASDSLRSLALRILLVGNDNVKYNKNYDLLLAKIEALTNMGQVKLAYELLAATPQGLRDEQHEEMLFLLQLLTGAGRETVCNNAEKLLIDNANAVWQRWVVLCQAYNKEYDKAKLGLELLREQNEISEFYERLVQYIIDEDNLAPQPPKKLNLQQLAKLVFAGQIDILLAKKQPLEMAGGAPLLASIAVATGADLPDMWQKYAKQYGVLAPKNLSPDDVRYMPDSSLMQFGANINKIMLRRGFITYALSKALSHDVSVDVEKKLANFGYFAAEYKLSPAWQGLLIEHMLQGRSGQAALLIVRMLHMPLYKYSVDDIAMAVKALYELGFVADANLLAVEAAKQASVVIDADEYKSIAAPDDLGDSD